MSFRLDGYLKRSQGESFCKTSKYGCGEVDLKSISIPTDYFRDIESEHLCMISLFLI